MISLRRAALLFALAMLCLVGAGRAAGDRAQGVIIAVGASGAEAYASLFADWAANWREAAARGGARVTTIGLEAAETDSADKLAAALAAEPKDSAEPLWLVLLGHGAAAGGESKFNLRGADVTAERIGEWLAPFRRPVVIVCGFATSGAWLKALAAPDRIVVTATRAAGEGNFSRFAGHLSNAIAEPEADLDQDGQTSLLEAYITASRATLNWYAQEGRLATEHALLDDNGDGAGTPGDWFKGVRAVKKPREGKADGARAHQLHLVRSADEQALSGEARVRRDRLERDLAALRDRKSEMQEPEYLKKIEAILVQIAKLYQGVKAEREIPAAAPAR